MELGTFIRQERTRRGLSQQELADQAGVGLNFVYQLEKNKQTVQLDKTNQVLRSLGYEVGAIRCFDPWQTLSVHQKPQAEKPPQTLVQDDPLFFQTDSNMANEAG